MSLFDWGIIAVYLVWVVWDGLRRTKDSTKIEGYFLANRSLPWWVVGLSVMATQLSAITMIGTTGQGYAAGMGLLQMYFALPMAMIFVAVTFVPVFRNARMYTSYEYLERRFDAKTRSLAALLFLLSRGMSCGVAISAPAVVLSVILGMNLTTACLLIGLPAAVYTMFGGGHAVAWNGVKQMSLIVIGLLAAVTALIAGLPHHVGVGEALEIAGTTGRLKIFDFSLDPTRNYTFWSGTLGAFFMFLAYFGTDQSQVQRYLTAKSVDQARTSLLMSAYCKIPLQALVLVIGVFLFLFYLFTPPPMLFNPAYQRLLLQSDRAAEYRQLQLSYDEATTARKRSAEGLAVAERSGDSGAKIRALAMFQGDLQRTDKIRAEAETLVRQVSGDTAYNDTNYVFPNFIITHLPVGVAGLLIASIIAAAMAVISGELSALSSSTVIDFYRRWIGHSNDEAHLLRVSRTATLGWAVFASVVAIWAAQLGALIEVVNRFGSYFYGSILGVFLLAVGWKRANGSGAFVAIIVGMGTVGCFVAFTRVGFLWYNLIGAVAVFIAGMVVSEFGPHSVPLDPPAVKAGG